MSLTTNYHLTQVLTPHEEMKGFQIAGPSSKGPLKAGPQVIMHCTETALNHYERPPLYPVNRPNIPRHTKGPLNKPTYKVQISSAQEPQDQSLYQLKMLVEKVTNIQGPGTYADLQAIREAKRVLISSSNHSENRSLKSSRAINDAIQPLFLKLKAKKTELLKCREVARGIIKERVIAKREGRKIRNALITTRQMFSVLNDRILGVEPEQLKDVCNMLCREINEVMESPAQYVGKSIQLLAKEKSYPFYSFEEKRTNTMTLDFTYWLEVAPDAEQFELFIVSPSDKPLGKGTYKTVYQAQSFKVQFKLERSSSPSGMDAYTRQAAYTPMVMLQANNFGSIATIEQGIGVQKKILKVVPETELTTLPLKLASQTPNTLNGLTHAQYRQEWYNCDLHQAMLSHKVPLDISKKPETLDFKDIDILNIFRDVALTLTKWHTAGVVHHDIKPSNILLKVLSDGKTIKGIPADYDISQAPGKGHSSEAKPYAYWDTLSNQGFVTRFTDFYGLSMSLAEAYIPMFVAQDRQTMLLKETQELFLHEAQKQSEVKARIVKKIIPFIVPIIKYDQCLSGNFSPQKLKEYREFEIFKVFSPYKDPLVIEMISQIPGFYEISTLQRAHELQNQIHKKLSDRSLDTATRKRLEEILSRNKQKVSYKAMKDSWEQMQPEDRVQHPLYLAFNKPAGIRQEKIDEYINKEIELIDLPHNSTLDECTSSVFSGNKTSYEMRQALKSQLLKISKDFSKPLALRLESTKSLGQIIMIEECMAYLYEIGKIENAVVDEVVKKTASSTQDIMQQFLTFINILKEELLTGEEKA